MDEIMKQQQLPLTKEVNKVQGVQPYGVQGMNALRYLPQSTAPVPLHPKSPTSMVQLVRARWQTDLY